MNRATRKGIRYGVVGTLAGWVVGGMIPPNPNHPLMALEETPQPTYGMPIEVPKTFIDKILIEEEYVRLRFDSDNDRIPDYEEHHTILSYDRGVVRFKRHPFKYLYDSNKDGQYDCLETIVDVQEDGLNENEKEGDCEL